MFVLAVPVGLFTLGVLLVPTLLFVLPVLNALIALGELAYTIGAMLLCISMYKAAKHPAAHHDVPWALAGLAIIALHLLVVL